jgi:hypothetical protein
MRLEVNRKSERGKVKRKAKKAARSNPPKRFRNKESVERAAEKKAAES